MTLHLTRADVTACTLGGLCGLLAALAFAETWLRRKEQR